MPPLPRLARLADLAVLFLIAVATAIAITGGIAVRLGGTRLSATSPGRVLLLALLVLAIRHAWIRRPSIWERLTTAENAAPSEERAASGASPVVTHVLVIGVFVVLVGVVMFEQVAHLRSVADLGDPLFSVWRLDWVAYQLRHDPLHLFDANIFHPELRTLAYSDAMLVPGLVAAPWIWMGVEPVVVHNLLMIAAAVASGVTMFWLVRTLTQSSGAGFVAGTVFALSPLRWAFYSHLELEVTHWMPLALLFLHRTLTGGRMRHGLATGAAVGLQALSSLYYGMFLSIYLCVIAAMLALTKQVRLRPAVGPLLCGAMVTAALVGPITLPYFENRRTLGQRSIEDRFSARPRDYLTAPSRSRLYANALPGRDGRLELFPGASPTALAASGFAMLNPGALAYAAALAVATDASMGTSGWTYPALYRWLVPFRGLRAPNRFAVLVALSLAVLGGYGTARLLRALRRDAARVAIVAALVAVVAVESAPALALTPVWPNAPPIYASLPADRNVVLVDLPFPQRDGPFWVEYSYLYFATVHHRRLVNGGSGFYPPWYNALAELMKSFPNDAAIATLRSHGAEYLVVHEAFYEPEVYTRVIAGMDARSDLAPVATAKWNDKSVKLYRFVSGAQ